MPVCLYLIRHGETAWSLSGQHTSRTEMTLTAKGEAAARKLATPLAAVKFSRVFTSPRVRAQQTCALAGLALAAQIEPDLAEWDYGDYEGRRSAEIREQRPEWDIYRDGCPQGESPEEITARADRLIRMLRALDGNIALFSHGHFGRVLAVRWIGLPVDQGRHFGLNTASLNLLGYESSQTPAILLWNAT